MRIIITNQGKGLVNCLGTELLSTNKGNNFINPLRELSNSNNKYFNKSFSIHKQPANTTNKSKFQKSNRKNKSNLEFTPIQNLRIIPIKQPKINIPKNISEKYNSDKIVKQKSSLLPSLPSEIIKKINGKENEHISFRSSFNNIEDNINIHLTIRDAITDGSLNKIRETLKSRNNEREKNFKLTEDNFRTNFKIEGKNDDINEMLSMNINSKHTNIINYLNHKEDLSYKFIKKICLLDENELTRLNRIFLKVNELDQKENLFKKIIEERCELRSKETNVECAKEIKNIGESLKKYREISEGYRPASKKEVLMEIHHQTKTKFWDKYQIERFRKKSHNKLNHIKTISEETRINNFRSKETEF